MGRAGGGRGDGGAWWLPLSPDSQGQASLGFCWLMMCVSMCVWLHMPLLCVIGNTLTCVHECTDIPTYEYTYAHRC